MSLRDLVVPGRGSSGPFALMRRSVEKRYRRLGDRLGADLMPDLANFPEKLWGIEDPRITYLSELGKYAVVFTAFSAGGPCVSLALTEDFRKRPR
jgi:hypothetical protein